MKIVVFLFAFVITLVVCGEIPHSEPRSIPLEVQSEADAKKRWSWENTLNGIKDSVNKVTDDAKDSVSKLADKAKDSASKLTNGMKDLQNQIEASIDNAKKELDKMNKNLGSKFNGVKKVVEKISIYLTKSTKFDCQDKQCELCFKVPIDVDSDKTSEACVNIILDVDNYGVKGTISFDDKVLIKKGISAKNPGSMCIPLPGIPTIKMCVRPYEPEINIKKKEFKICLETNMSAFSKQLIAINLNCFIMENGKDFYLARPNEPSKKALINVDTGNFFNNRLDKKLKL